MILLSARNITKTYMERKVLDHVSFYLNEGDKVGIIGINGTGKSTLLKILAGAQEADSGELIRTKGVRISYLPQIPEFDDNGTILEQVMLHLPADLKEAKEFEARSILSKLGINDTERLIGSLSGGEKRRAGIAAALIQPSDVLLLDEPTNHIDSATVELLEEQLKKYRGAIIMVTHDRYFLESITEKIAEVDGGKVYEYEGNYDVYLEQKAQREADMEARERKNRAVYRRELEWIRRGVRARGTKSKDRIERFHQLEDREIPTENAKLQMQSVSSRLGKKTIEINGISKSIDGRTLIKDLSCIIPRDARIGIVGENGAGKTTLMRLISGELEPDSGWVEFGETVRIGYFSQECESMDPTQRVIDYIRDTAERIETPEGTVTASQMLERFLFTSELQWNTIEKLSGGERKRLYLLKVLMTAPNILLLDEPTNDLDIATLTILEDYLESFAGAVIAISHDRFFLDRTVDRIWEISGGNVTVFNGNYSDYAQQAADKKEAAVRAKKKSEGKREFVGEKKLRFSYKEQKEYETIDDDIAALENGITETEQQISKCVSDYVKLSELTAQKEKLEQQLEEKMDRWVYLNDLAEKIAAQ